MNQPWGRLLPILFAVFLFVIGLNVVVILNNLEILNSQNSWVQHTYGVRTELDGVKIAILQAENAQRNFIITGQQQYLNQFQQIAPSLPKLIDNVRSMTTDNPSEQINSNKLKEIIQERLISLNKGVALRQAEGFDESEGYVSQGIGKSQMDQINQTTDAMVAEENDLLLERVDQAQQSFDFLVLSISFAAFSTLFLAVLSYILLRRELTRKYEIQKRQNEFISIASHELRNPITAMNMFLSLLKGQVRRYKDKQANHYIRRIQEQVSKQVDFITELLDLSRMETGRIDLNLKKFKLNSLAKESIESMQATTKNHQIIFKGKPGIEVLADRERIAEVIDNFLSNAVKYSPKGGEIIVRLTKQGKMAVLSVQDFGIGIDPANLKKIFERFFRAENGRGAPASGLGLGLYICSEIIKLHGGRIWVESAKGEGSVFHFSIPTS